MKKIIFKTKSAKGTQKFGEKFAKKILELPKGGEAVVLCLEGELGAGKTTFLQGFARGLKIKEKITSPTFVIFKKFQISKRVKNTRSRVFHAFYHIDCYRLNNEKDILQLGWKEMISDKKNIIAVEWPERIKKILPKNRIKIKLKFINEKTREIVVR